MTPGVQTVYIDKQQSARNIMINVYSSSMLSTLYQSRVHLSIPLIVTPKFPGMDVYASPISVSKLQFFQQTEKISEGFAVT